MSDVIKNVNAVSGMVNDYSFNPQEFCERFKREHRTLQQSFTRLCLEWIKTCASEDYRTDGRNEASHIVCKKIVDTMEQDPDWDYLPFI